MSNQFCHNHQTEDYKNILKAFALKKYVKMMVPNQPKEMRICLQIAKPEHKDLYYSGLSKTQKVDQVLCIEELKLQLLAKSSVCPGIITIIWSLITSDTTGDDDDGDSDPDDMLTEILNSPGKREAWFSMVNKDKGERFAPVAKKTIKPEAYDLF